MNREQFTRSKSDAFAAWSPEATSDGYQSSTPSQLCESLGEWEANYLLPQLLLGAEYPAGAINERQPAQSKGADTL